MLRHSAHLDALHADPIRDWQLHLRDGASLAVVLPHTAERFGCAIVLPNLKPPVSTVATAAAHRKRILAARPKGSPWEPWMTLCLTDNTPASEIAATKQSGICHAVQIYTHSLAPRPTRSAASPMGRRLAPRPRR